MSLKYITSALCLMLCSTVAYGECALSQVDNKRDQNIFPDVNDTTHAFVCGNDHCADGEIIYVTTEHKIGNGWGGLSTISDARLYKCNASGNDHKWVVAHMADLAQCDDDEERSHYGFTHSGSIMFWEATDGVRTNICLREPKEKDGVKCDKDKDEETYYFASDENMCRCSMGRWGCGYGSSLICGDPTSPDYVQSGITRVGGVDADTGMYLIDGKTSIANGVYNYDDVCRWCEEGLYFGGSYTCYEDLDMAWCYFAKNNNGEHTDWQNAKCVCMDENDENIDETKTWDPVNHTCVDAKSGATKKTTETKSQETTESADDESKAEVPDLYAPDCPAGSKKDDNCSLNSHAKTAKCMNLGKKDSSGNDVLTCTAWDCEPNDYYLYMKSGKSQGICHAKSYAENVCKKNGTCPAGCKNCVPNLQPTPRTNVANGAYDGCHCADEQLKITVVDDNKTTPPQDTVEIDNAKKSLDAFFKSTESHKSGLKTADGKFNTVRLASDISAGVILGTVGGVVSGVVIKKKQVEKGFEALHCTVGGQTVADWGDTFEVGLRH